MSHLRLVPSPTVFDMPSPAISTAYLVSLPFTTTGSGATRFSLSTTQEVRIGRGDPGYRVRGPAGRQLRLDVRLADIGVSRAHAVISGHGTQWTVADLESKNGTRVNGKRITEHLLADGDVLEVGRHLLVFRRELPLVQRDIAASCSNALSASTPLHTVNAVMEAAVVHARSVARAEVVLLRGERGTGAAELATLMHEHSGRTGLFVPVFTGEVPLALVSTAEGGTLFVDDVGALSADRQTRLLNLLQQGPLAKQISLVVSASPGLARAVKAGRFRAELYQRLAAKTVDLPPLRARPEDILLLSRQFVAMVSGRRAQRLTMCRCAVSALLRYDWPGNAMQLEHTLVCAAAAAVRKTITVDHLPELVRDNYRSSGECSRQGTHIIAHRSRT